MDNLLSHGQTCYSTTPLTLDVAHILDGIIANGFGRMYYYKYRTHQEKMCSGRTPVNALEDGKSIWAEKKSSPDLICHALTKMVNRHIRSKLVQLISALDLHENSPLGLACRCRHRSGCSSKSGCHRTTGSRICLTGFHIFQ